MRPAGTDVVVIGAGSIGASIAYELTLRGASVRIVDQGTSPAAECSRANAGLLVPSHSEPLTGAGNIRTGLRNMLSRDSAFHIRPSLALLPWLLRYTAASTTSKVDTATRLLRDFGLTSLGRHAEYVEHGVPTSFTRQGMIDVFASEQKQREALASIARNPVGLDYQVLDRAQVVEAVPGIVTASGGVLFRNEAHCDSRLFVEAAVSAARHLGAQLSLATRVRSLRHRLGRVVGVDTSGEFYPADAVVIAAGHRSADLTRPLGLRLPMAAAKGYVIDLEPGTEDPSIPVGLKEDMVVLTPYADRLRLAGSLELVGPDTTINRRRVDSIRRSATRALPHLVERATLAVSAGLRPCSPDGLPMIGTTTAAKGLLIATGHGQQGLVLAPATGCAVADMMCIESARSPVPEFSPDRFTTVRH